MMMKSILWFSGFALGMGVAGTIGLHTPNKLKVGDCVRDIGYDQIETVTVVQGKFVETQNPYGDGRFERHKYDNRDQLVKVSCQ